MKNDRRNILRILGGVGLGLCSGAGSMLLNSCSKEVLSPFKTGYKITELLCTGCGDCIPACYYKAIILPEESKYFIDKTLCTECGKCVPQCKESAITVIISKYSIAEDKCIGCGKCIDACKIEADCIVYEKADYTVKNKCKPRICQHQCGGVCEFGAISIGDRCKIDMSKCTKCGKCVSACPYAAINPAKVSKDDAKCTNCGACFKVCEFEAITKTTPDNYVEPNIDKVICTACGECKVFCLTYNAIGWNTATATIDRNLCTDCGKCEPECTYKAIKLDEL